MKLRYLALLALLGVTLFPAMASAQAPVTVGEHVTASYQTPHPYAGTSTKQPTLIHSDTIQHAGAIYISVHFNRMQLAPGDHVVVRSLSGAQSWTYTGNGKAGAGRTSFSNGWYATHVKGDTAIVELFTTSGTNRAFGYSIDGYGRGYNQQEINDFWQRGLGDMMNLPEPTNLNNFCGTDDTRNPICYQTSEPTILGKSQAIARLTINGVGSCTGWLVGSEGHLMTNEHCISTANEALNTDYEFNAEALNCNQDCGFAGACPGQVHPSGTLVRTNNPLDYTLIKLPAALANSQGYLQLRASGGSVGERIYIPQHPGGWGKRIAVGSTHAQDTNGYPTITGLGEPSCSGVLPAVGTWADVRPGSSGSPVLAYSDHQVVGLLHCRGNVQCTNNGGDPNRAVAIDDIINDLGNDVPPNAIATPNQPPSAAFSFSCANLTCSFDASASSDDSGITSYQWFFGDGAQGSGVTDLHTYASNGTYSVRLRVSDAAGQVDDLTKSVTVGSQDNPPTASFTFSCNALSCTFNGSGSSDDNGISSYQWLFGDGTQGTGVTSQHTYASSNTYSVRLRVFDAAGQSDDQVRSVTVSGCSDTINPSISHQGNLAPYVWDAFQLKATASDNVGVTRVDFYRANGGQFLCSDTSAPYVCNLNADNYPTGTLSYRARAYDACGNSRVTGIRSTQTVREPLGNLEVPTDGTTIAGPAVSISGWALDPDGIDTVSVTLGGLSAGPTQPVSRPDVCNTIAVADPACPNPGWTAMFDTTTLPNGSYPVRAEVTDFDGRTTVLGIGHDVIVNNQTVPPCTEDAYTLCLRGDRFQVRAEFNGGSVARAVPKDDKNGLFWFFGTNNLEISTKIIGPDAAGYFWVFHGSLTSLEYDLIVTDTFTGLEKTFHKPVNNYCGGVDYRAFEEQMLQNPNLPEASRSGGVLLDAGQFASPMPMKSVISTGGSSGDGLVAVGENVGSCSANSTTLCLQQQRFQVRILRGGVAQSAVGLTADTGSFWFFTADNTEVVVKVLENLGNHWVFYGSLTDRDYTLEVTDTLTGTSATYTNPLGTYCGGADLGTF